MTVHQFGRPRPQNGTFVRMDGHSLEEGVVIAYKLQGLNFGIKITRDGIDIGGRFPRVTAEGVNALVDMLHRAVRHQAHLASFPIGERQTTIPEQLFEEEEAQRDARAAQTVETDATVQ